MRTRGWVFGAMGVVGLACLSWVIREAPTAQGQTARCYDRDSDGHDDVACGGDDCNDTDPSMFPGNIEVCDADSRDEDCDPTTFGYRDQDGDGHHDSRCCNVGRDGTRRCGTDCDDTRSAVNPSAQVCNARDVAFCRAGGFEMMSCGAGTVCVPQPNGLGVCGVQPPGYQTPPRVVAPRLLPLPRVQRSVRRAPTQPSNSQIQLRSTAQP